ncbi:hypothetical protein BDZ91DRAFT_714086 [Kalaharituber pfeilii]|nr:hypothetical protein BDZ91DRAFT_714086 [Kalaharituber pfeilii]
MSAAPGALASASPGASDTTNTPTTPAEGAQKLVYRPPRRNVDPLRRRPDKRSRPQGAAASTPKPPGTAPGPPRGPSPNIATTPTPEPLKEDPTITWTSFPLKTTKKALMKDLRFHVMRLQHKNVVDITEPDQFTLPIRLHRRDPRAPPQGAKEEQAALAAEEEGKKLDPEEQKKLEEAQAAKEAEQAATLAAIAPYGGAQRQKKNAFKKKTQQVFQTDEKAKKLRYEEYFPWHIEDFDNKNTWVGNLEGALSDGSQAIFVMDGDCFRMIPIEKWYKFTQRSNFKTLTIEEAEAAMKKKSKTPRWLMEVTKAEEKAAKAKEDAENKAAQKSMYLVKGDRLVNRPREEAADADEIDYDENFQDDEEAPIMDGEEEENRQIEKRIKREQLGANVFDQKTERDWEEEERERKRKEQLEKKTGRKVIKYLRGHEKNLTYETDSDENPYASSEEDSSAEELKREEERKKAEEKKREEERKQLEAEKKKREEEEAAKKAAASLQVNKVDDKLTKSPKKTEKHKQIKRTSAADPYLSESGTDTGNGRKKLRKNAPVTPAPQPPTPVPTPDAGIAPPNKLVKLKVGPGNLAQVAASKKRPRDGTGSDNEAAGGGGETSAKLKFPAQNTGTITSSTPASSAAGADGKPKSGAPITGTPRAASPSTTASRAASPGSTPAPTGTSIDITADEVRAVLNSKPEGQELKEFLSHFKGRVGKENMTAFLALLKPLSKQKGKLICPK